jgi:putative hydrolase of the HAD superfamily
MSTSLIRGILFDLGNVIIKIDSGRFAEKMKSLMGLEMEQLRPAFTEGGLVIDYECGRMDDDEFVSRLCSRLGVTITRDDFDLVWSCMFNEAPILSEELLAELAQECPLWAISNTNRMHFEYIRKQYGLLRHFRGLSLSYEVGAAKPDPAIFTHALDGCGIGPSEALFIDDQPVNVESARSLGIEAIQFLNPAQIISEFRARNLLSNYA